MTKFLAKQAFALDCCNLSFRTLTDKNSQPTDVMRCLSHYFAPIAYDNWTQKKFMQILRTHFRNLSPGGPISTILLASDSACRRGGGWLTRSRDTSRHVILVGVASAPGGTMTRTFCGWHTMPPFLPITAPRVGLQTTSTNTFNLFFTRVTTNNTKVEHYNAWISLSFTLLPSVLRCSDG